MTNVVENISAPSVDRRIFVESRVVTTPPAAASASMSWRAWGCVVGLAAVSPLSAIVVYLVARTILGNSDQRLYMLWVGVPRMVSYATALPVGVWLLVRARKGELKVPSGFQCLCWWMLVQGVFMLYSNIRGLDLLDTQYEGAEREYRATYLTLQIVGNVPDVLLGLLWLVLLFRQGSAICCCGEDGPSRRR